MNRVAHDFAHTAMIVDSDDHLRARLLPHVRRSLQIGEPVVMVVSEHTAHVVRDDLGRLGDKIEWCGPGLFYQQLGSTYERFRRYLADQHAAGRRVHMVAEPD